MEERVFHISWTRRESTLAVNRLANSPMATGSSINVSGFFTTIGNSSFSLGIEEGEESGSESSGEEEGSEEREGEEQEGSAEREGEEGGVEGKRKVMKERGTLAGLALDLRGARTCLGPSNPVTTRKLGIPRCTNSMTSPTATAGIFSPIGGVSALIINN